MYIANKKLIKQYNIYTYNIDDANKNIATLYSFAITITIKYYFINNMFKKNMIILLPARKERILSLIFKFGKNFRQERGIVQIAVLSRNCNFAVNRY